MGGWFELGKGNVWEEPDDLKRGLRCVSLRALQSLVSSSALYSPFSTTPARHLQLQCSSSGWPPNPASPLGKLSFESLELFILTQTIFAESKGYSAL